MTVRVGASDDAVAEVDERYLSVCLDLGQVAEPTRFWNPDGSGEVVGLPSFDFERRKVLNMTRALAPAFLRIGGTEADRAFYALEPSDSTTPPAPFRSILTAKHVDAIGGFAQAVGFDVCFTLNAGHGARGAGGEWESGQARRLMRYVRQRKYPFSVFELGNEPNAWPLFHNGLLVQPEDYARDARELCRARDDECPAAKVAGPSCAFWPSLGEVSAFVLWPPRRIATISKFTARVLAAEPGLDIVTWHYYPGLSTRSALAKHRTAAVQAAAAAVAVFAAAAAAAAAGGGALPPPWLTALGALAALASALAALLWRVVRPVSFQALRDPAFLDTAAEWAARVGEMCDTAFHETVPRDNATPPSVWLGETGSAQVGGEPGVSGRWGSALWWLDQLGLLALRGQRVQCRQTLLGSDYGLIDATSLEGTPDFWASVLWKRLMGPQVLAVRAAGAPRTLRLYCHRPPRALLGGPMSTFIGAPPSARRTFLAINLGRDRAEIDLSAPARVWLLEAASDDASTVSINGKAAATRPDGTVPDFPGVPVDATPLVVPPGAALFALV